MREHKLAFVGGVHGVGKTSLSRSISAALNATHVSAGSLIAKVRATSSSKQVEDVEANQDAVILGVESTKIESHLVLMDGHFGLIGAAGDFRAVPLSTFHALAPDILLVVVAPPAVIAQRLYARDKRNWPTLLLQRFQDQEISMAAEVSRSLSIPLFTVQSDQTDLAIYHIGSVLRL